MQLDLNENCDKQEASWISERLDAATYDARLQQVSLVNNNTSFEQNKIFIQKFNYT
jgi:hypothetical protein